MDISSVLSSENTSRQTPSKRAGTAVKSIIDSIISQSQQANASQDIAALSLVAKLRSNTADLRTSSNKLAYISSQTQVARAGIDDIRSSLTTLKSLAEQASKPNISPQTRERLSAQAEEFTGKIDIAVEGATFDGRKLLKGDLSGKNALSLKSALSAGNPQAESVRLSIDDLSSDRLLKKPLDLSSPEKAKEALGTINEALAQTAGARDDARVFQDAVDYISATLDSVAANQSAAQSLLPELDLAPGQGNGFFSIATLQQNVANELNKAQGVNASLLNLIK